MIPFCRSNALLLLALLGLQLLVLVDKSDAFVAFPTTRHGVARVTIGAMKSSCSTRSTNNQNPHEDLQSHRSESCGGGTFTFIKKKKAAPICNSFFALHVSNDEFGDNDDNDDDGEEEEEYEYYDIDGYDYEEFGSSSSEKDEDEDNEDWRTFRAKLVSLEKNSHHLDDDDGEEEVGAHQKKDKKNKSSNSSSRRKKKSSSSPSTSSFWVYDSGTNIEPGTILLHNPYCKNSSHQSQQHAYLHKSVILILEHDRNGSGMTTGMVLNRPTDLLLCEELSSDNSQSHGHGHGQGHGYVEWNVWYGGHDHGLHTREPRFHCLHSLPIMECSYKIVDGIYFSALQDARLLVQHGIAQPDDFWTFSGTVTWRRSSDLTREIERGGWYAAAMDARVVKKGLGGIVERITSGKYAHIGNSEDHIWKLFMRLIGQRYGGTSTHRSNSSSGGTSDWFAGDEILEVWSRENLVFNTPPRFFQDEEEH